MISHKYKCIFVHIPRTGGSSVEWVLWPDDADRTEENLWMGFIDEYHNPFQTGGLQHLLARQIREAVAPEAFSSYYKFSIVRNPWDKMASQFAYMKHRPDLREFIGMDESDDLSTYLTLIQTRLHVQWEDQHKFIFDDNGEQLVDHIIRFEDLELGIKTVFAHLGVRSFWGMRPARLPHRNRSNRSHYREHYDAETRDLVGEMFARDIKLFNFEF